jgi:signal transduction histidine kinase
MENLDPKELACHLSSGVGHQVINAFSTIVSQGEVLRSLLGPTSEHRAEIDQRIDTIIQTALDAALMTRRMMDYTIDAIAIDPDRPGKGLEEVFLDRLLSEVAEEERVNLGPGVGLVLDLAALPPIRGHRRALRDMLRCLIRNASEAMQGRSGTIALRVAPEPQGWITIEIRDDGAGLTPEVMEHATEPFFTTRPGHRGVGLTIARAIWRRHRGTLAIDSEPGQGALVRLMVAARSPD